MKEFVEKLLVGIDKGAQLCGQGKNHMKIWGVNDLAAPFVNPFFLFHLLALGTITVATGTVVDTEIGTIIADCGIEAHGRRFAVHNRICGLKMYQG